MKAPFSTTRLFSVARALASGSFVAYLAYRGLREHALDLARLPGHFGYIGVVASQVARTVCRDAALLGLGLGVVDLVVVRRAWMVRLRMSKDEIKREHKESDGDPQMKAACGPKFTTRPPSPTTPSGPPPSRARRD